MGRHRNKPQILADIDKLLVDTRTPVEQRIQTCPREGFCTFHQTAHDLFDDPDLPEIDWVQELEQKCSCGSTAKVDYHANDCDLWMSWDFDHGWAQWDDEAKTLIPLRDTNVWKEESDAQADKAPDFTGMVRAEDQYDDLFEEYEYSSGARAVMANGSTMTEEEIHAYIDQLEVEIAEKKGAPMTVTDLTGSSVTTASGAPSPSATTPVASTPYKGTTYVQKCRHYQFPVELLDGTIVYASSQHRDRQDDPIPDLGIYLDGMWQPDTIAYHVGCPDYGVPNPEVWKVIHIAKEGLRMAKLGKRVEVGCIGGHGRTGLMLCIMNILSDPHAMMDHPTEELCMQYGLDTVKDIRAVYCDHAVESPKQVWYIQGIACEVNGLPWPEMPKPPPQPKWTPPAKPYVPTPGGTNLFTATAPKTGGAVAAIAKAVTGAVTALTHVAPSHPTCGDKNPNGAEICGMAQNHFGWHTKWTSDVPIKWENVKDPAKSNITPINPVAHQPIGPIPWSDSRMFAPPAPQISVTEMAANLAVMDGSVIEDA